MNKILLRSFLIGLMLCGGSSGVKASAGNPLETPFVFFKVAPFLEPVDLSISSGLSHQARGNAIAYHIENISEFTRKSVNTVEVDPVLERLRRKLDDLDCLVPHASQGNMRYFPRLRDQVRENLKESCFFSPCDPLFSSALKDTHQILPGFQLYKLFKDDIVESLFSEDEKDESYRAVIAQYLLNSLNLFVPKEKDIAEIVQQEIWTKHRTAALLNHLKDAKSQKRFVRFDPDHLDDLRQTMEQATCHLVVESTQMAAHKQTLEGLLENNLDHVVLLNAGQPFVDPDTGCFAIETEQLPNNLRHIVITDHQGMVKLIRDYCLIEAISLQTFDTCGLTAVRRIGDRFLECARMLRSFDTRGLTSVTRIGESFLFAAGSLLSFDTRGLTSLTTIEDNFLYSAKALKSFDTNGLTAVKTIGRQFLWFPTSLRSFDTRGLISLETIGKYFLCTALALESFDTARLTAVKTIGDDFLNSAHMIKTFDTRGLTAVKTIGDYFLHKAERLKSFDTRGFISLETIGKYFLCAAIELESFDTKGLTAVKTIGNGFLYKAEELKAFDARGLTSIIAVGDDFLSKAYALESSHLHNAVYLKTIKNRFLLYTAVLQSVASKCPRFLQPFFTHHPLNW